MRDLSTDIHPTGTVRGELELAAYQLELELDRCRRQVERVVARHASARDIERALRATHRAQRAVDIIAR